MADAIQGLGKQKLLRQDLNPKADREHAFGDELGRRWGRDNAGDGLAVALGAIPGPLMNAADQTNLPVDYLAHAATLPTRPICVQQ